MRKIFVLLILVSSLSVKAQSSYRPSFGYTPMGISGINSLHYNNLPANKKWFWTSSAGISTGFSTFSGGNASFVSAPVGLQLNRQINKNLYAFAGVTVAPTYMNFNGAFLSPGQNKFSGNNMLRSNQFGLYSRAEMGLFYTNDSRTFSISGSISVERSNYPVMPYYQTNQNRQPVNNTNR